MKYFQMPVNSSNLKNFPSFTPKGHPRFCWFVWIILKLQRTEIENSRIDTINTITMSDRIDCINQYKGNWFYQSDLLTLHTSPTQLHHCCFLFRCFWLIKVRSIFVLYKVSSFWCAHRCFIFFLYLPLNPIVVRTAQVRLLSQRGMDYCCVYTNEIFLPIFILLTEPSSCVTVNINYNKEDLKIMSSLTHDDGHQSSDVLLSIW